MRMRVFPCVLALTALALVSASVAEPQDPVQPGYASLDIEHRPDSWSIGLWAIRSGGRDLEPEQQQGLAEILRRTTNCESIETSGDQDYSSIGGDCPWIRAREGERSELSSPSRLARVELAPLLTELSALEITTFTVSSSALGFREQGGAETELRLIDSNGIELEERYGVATLEVDSLLDKPDAALELSVAPIAWQGRWSFLLAAALTLHLAFGLSLRLLAGRALRRLEPPQEDRPQGAGIDPDPASFGDPRRTLWWRLGRYQFLLTLIALFVWVAAPIASGMIAATDWLDGPSYPLRFLALAVSFTGFLLCGSLTAAGLSGLRSRLRPADPGEPASPSAASLFLLRWSTLLVPFLLAITTADAMVVAPAVSAATGILAVLVALLLLKRLLRVSGLVASTLPAGELRSTILGMAASSGIEIGSLTITSGRELRVANAAVMAGRRLMFTQYLIDHLPRDEVRAIIGHELSHLRHGDIKKRVVTIVATTVVAIPAAFAATIFAFIVSSLLGLDAGEFGAAFPIALFGAASGVLTAVALSFLLFRQQEFRADAEGADATDPETMIRALVRMTHVSWMPMEWTFAGRILATHPSTTQRIARLARMNQIDDSRLAELVEGVKVAPSLEEVPGTAEGNQLRFPVPDNAARVFCHARRSAIVQRLGLVQLALVVGTPLVLLALISGQLPLMASILAVLFLAPILTLGLYLLLFDRLAYLGYSSMAAALRARCRSVGEQPDDVFVGLSEGDRPQLYETHWDRDLGWLRLEREKLVFEDDCQRFEIPRAAIVKTWLGNGPASPLPSQRLFLAVRECPQGADEKAILRTLNLSAPGPLKRPSRRGSRRAVIELHQRIERWLEQPEPEPEGAEASLSSATTLRADPSSPEGTPLSAVMNRSMVFAIAFQSGATTLLLGLLLALGGAIDMGPVPAAALATSLSMLGLSLPQLKRNSDSSASSRPAVPSEVALEP